MEITNLDSPRDFPLLESKRKRSLSSLIVCENRCPKRSHVAVREEMKNIFANDDIAIEILSRLPIESIKELKFVCKRWCELFSHPSFSIAQFQLSTRNISGLFIQGLVYCGGCCENYLDEEEVDYISIGKEGRHETKEKTLDFLPEEVVVTASCNGVLLCRNIYEGRHPHRSRHMKGSKPKEVVLYVCNPLTKEWRSLKPKGRYKNGCCYGFSYNLFGSSVSPNFEVVMVQPPLDLGKDPYIFNIYSARTDAWRTSKEVCSLADRLHLHQSCSTNGVFYWLTTGHSILTFDLKQEKYQVIKLPGDAMHFQGEEGVCLGVSNGNLHYICFNMDELMVWVLNDDDNSIPKWALKHSKPLLEMHHRIMDTWAGRRPIEVDGNKWPNSYMKPHAFQDDILFVKVNWILCTYNIRTGEFEEELCCFYKLRTSENGTPIVIPYCKSLLQVQDREYIIQKPSHNKASS